MLINSIALKNFKCFEELDVKFAPITLLTGANSSGKSSLINAILAILQTEQFPFYLSPNGKYVNMGSFEEMVFAKRSDSTVRIDISVLDAFDLISTNAEKFAYSKINYKELMSYISESEFIDINNYLSSYKTEWLINKINDLPELQSIKVKENDLYYEINKSKDYNFEINIDPIWFDIEDYKSIAYEHKGTVSQTENRVHLKASDFKSIDELNSSIKNIFDYRFREFHFDLSMIDNSFNYIGSFRSAPERTYYQKSKTGPKILNAGEGYIDQIIEWEEKKDVKFNELVSIINNLELVSDLKSSRLKGGRFELSVKTKSNADYASLVDVGFGVSQFLPILVADLQLNDNSCLAISQPEIHLHPKIQATFGNYLADRINNSLKQYIVETHSEYLLNRIRLLLVTGELKPEDVRVLYFENDGIKSTVHDVEFTTDGQIKGAPQGFFDTYGIDVMNIAMNALG